MGPNHTATITALRFALLARVLDRHKRSTTLDTLSKLILILCEKYMFLVQSRAN